MGVRESTDLALLRWQKLELLQKYYPTFDLFLVAVMEDLLGFQCSDLQIDIGDYIVNGPQYSMVQAQRGQAKTTIAAAAAVFFLIHNPKTRILIISAGDTQATEIANWIIQIINGMPELECMRADRSNGDRASVEAYDIHYSLKGPEKSPSIACIGITSNMQGKRADFLIADDIESSKNGLTQVQRDKLVQLSRDFPSICSNGKILYLGTPQSIDSIYNGLPQRGYSIRIWPGRYPNAKEQLAYGAYLAPMILNKLTIDPSVLMGGGLLGDEGQPTDPVIKNEASLQKTALDQGAAYFQLQHMLNTSLADAARFPLKVSNIRVFAFDREQRVAPMALDFARIDQNRISMPAGYPVKEHIFRVQSAENFGAIPKYHMYIDSAGGGANQDELAYAITGFCAGRVFGVDIGGIVAGITEDSTSWLIERILKWKPDIIHIEKNFGNGALANTLRPALQRRIAEIKKDQPTFSYNYAIEDVWEAGQKELRICDVLEPIIAAGKFVLHEDLVLDDWQSCFDYPIDKRSTYCLMWQIARVTRERQALIHDDRLDALAGSARFWVESLAKDDLKAIAEAKKLEYDKMVRDPLGRGKDASQALYKALRARMGASEPNALDKARRKF